MDVLSTIMCLSGSPWWWKRRIRFICFGWWWIWRKEIPNMGLLGVVGALEGCHLECVHAMCEECETTGEKIHSCCTTMAHAHTPEWLLELHRWQTNPPEASELPAAVCRHWNLSQLRPLPAPSDYHIYLIPKLTFDYAKYPFKINYSLYYSFNFRVKLIFTLVWY